MRFFARGAVIPMCAALLLLKLGAHALHGPALFESTGKVPVNPTWSARQKLRRRAALSLRRAQDGRTSIGVAPWCLLSARLSATGARVR